MNMKVKRFFSVSFFFFWWGKRKIFFWHKPRWVNEQILRFIPRSDGILTLKIGKMWVESIWLLYLTSVVNLFFSFIDILSLLLRVWCYIFSVYTKLSIRNKKRKRKDAPGHYTRAFDQHKIKFQKVILLMV